MIKRTPWTLVLLLIPALGSATENTYSTLEEAVRIKLTDAQASRLQLSDAAPASVLRGQRIYATKCQYCHGHGIEKHASNVLLRRYREVDKAVLALRTDLTPEFITTFVRNNTVGMVAFRQAELPDEALEDLIAYLTRNNPG